MTYRIVSCFGPGGWEQYAKRFVETFVEHWAPSIQLTIFYHDCDLPAEADAFKERVQFVKLSDVDPEYVEFAKKIEASNGMQQDGTYNYRFDAKKFSPKVFATTLAMSSCQEDWLIWLDADTFTHAPVTEDTLAELVGGDRPVDLVYLPRTSIYYAETSFIAFRNKSNAAVFLADMRDMYVDGEMLWYVEKHDGFVFERLLYLHKLHGLEVKGLTNSGYTGLEAFENSPLSKYMHHLKGNLKKAAPMPVIVTRYDQLNELIKFYAEGREHYTLLETGTWNGKRAIEMANAAFAAGARGVTYYGFDLFDHATEETDKAEFNSKAHNTLDEVTKRLNEYAAQVALNGREFKFHLTAGDTKATLRDLPAVADFAYLDGGHSPETALHDYEQCRCVPVVVFDDYITPDVNGQSQPPEHCGTNQVFDKLEHRKKVYGSNDPVKGGGHTHLAAVLHDDKLPEFPDLPETAGAWKKLVIQPHDCVEKPHLISNVEANLKLIPKWIRPCKPHNRKMVIVSGGPGVVKDMPTIARMQAQGAFVVAVKHAVPYLVDAGVHFDGVIVLDPRPVDGISTHGKKRKDLFASLPISTKAFVASMTDPATTEYLIGRGCDVWGWHAGTQGLAQWKGWPKDTRLVSGGTCSAWRMVSLGFMLGFLEFHLFGMDLSYPEGSIDLNEKDEQGRPKYMRVSPDQGKTMYVTTGELAAAAQDTRQMFMVAQNLGLEVYLHGKGFGPDVWNNLLSGVPEQKRQSFEDLMA